MSEAKIEGKTNNSKDDLCGYLKNIDETISSLSKLRLFILDIIGDFANKTSIDLDNNSFELSGDDDLKESSALIDESINASDELAKKIDLLMSNVVAHDTSLELIKLFQTSQSTILTGISEKIDTLIDKKNDQSVMSNAIAHDQSVMSNAIVHKCAPVLGQIGEEDIVNNLNIDFPNMFVKHVSNISHQCDIHVEDPISNILYMIEVKNKLSITKEDIDKFEFDIDKSGNKRTIGLFISLNCENIPGKISPINPFYIDINKIYMIGYNKEILSLIFTIISKFIFANNEVDIDKDISLLCQRVKAIQETRQKRIIDINSNINSLKTVILNEEAMKYELEHELQLLSQCDMFVESNCGNCNAINSAASDEKKALIEYIKLNKNSFTKKNLISKFPLQSAFIKSKTIAELKELE